MPKIIWIIAELALFILMLWLADFVSTLLHELGHAAGYVIGGGKGVWHIRVGTGPRLVKTKRLTVNLFVTDGCFSEPEDCLPFTRGRLFATLSGGPIVSLLLTLGLLLLRFSGVAENSAIFASDAAATMLDISVMINAAIFLLSVLPIHYPFGGIKGMESDGLQMINALKESRKQN